MNIKVYKDLANKGNSPRELAQTFLKDYYKKTDIVYPINPFQMLKDLKIYFVFRDFSKAEGIYIPAKSRKDIAIVGININRPIQRQRFTAAHELCHHLKDSTTNYICQIGDDKKTEKYANNFAAELLMPINDFRKKVSEYIYDGEIEDFDILKVANYFGVSYEACLRRIFEIFLNKTPSYNEIKKLIDDFKPNKQKEKLKLYDYPLYKQIIDSIADEFTIKTDKFTCEVFKSEYIFYDSRMEGINVDKQKAGDIIADLRLYKQNSKYCKETNQNIIELAGLSFMYDYVFEHTNDDISIYTSKELNKLLYSTAPHPENTGEYRKSNTLVEGAKFETIDYHNIPAEMMYLGSEIDNILYDNESNTSDYIEKIIRLHHRLTIVHPFQDGNGRTSRSLCNMLLLRRNIPPVFFTNENKKEYKDSLRIADTEKIYEPLYESFFKSIIKSFALLTDSIH